MANDDFAALLDEYDPGKQKRVSVGDRVSAKVIHLGKEDVFFALGVGQEAHMPRAALGERNVAIGDVVEAMVMSTRDGIELGLKLGHDRLNSDMLEQARAAGMPIDGTVTGLNKGGLEVTIGGTRAFCPLGQIGADLGDDPQSLVGKTLQFLVREVREGGRNIVLSRRALIEAERRSKGNELKKTLQVGQRVKGTVTRITDFGVFVDLGGLDGMIPLGELSHSRVKDAREVVKEGDAIEVDVLRMEDDPKRPGQLRIGLSLKATQASAPGEKVASGQAVEVTVVSVERGGVVVNLPNGASAFLPAAESGTPPGADLARAFAPGTKVTVRAIDPSAKGRPRVSKRAHDEAEERGMLDAYNRESGAPKSLGTLGDLLNKKKR